MDVRAWRNVANIRPPKVRPPTMRRGRKHNPFLDVDPSEVHKDHHDPLIGSSAIRATPAALLAMTGFNLESHHRLHSMTLSVRAYIQSNSDFRYHPVFLAAVFVIGGFAILFVGSGVAYAAIMHDYPTPTRVVTSVSRAIPIAAVLDKKPEAPKPPKKTAALAPAVEGIPGDVMRLYRDAAATCGVQWEILAAVGKIETNHGQSNAPGVHSGENFAGAKGPMQFMTPTWAKYGVDGDHNGAADIYNQTDAIYGAANYLCANGAADPNKLNNAVWHYNHDQSYVNSVIATAKKYQSGAYVVPLPQDVATSINLGKPHHDYPADDIPVPVGTPVYAARGGKVRTLSNGACGYGVIITGTDGNTYTYCHASSLDVKNGTSVDTGDLILHSGGKPGTAGAGDSTGPHLHFQINAKGRNVCPQGLLAAWEAGKFEVPDNATSNGCVG